MRRRGMQEPESSVAPLPGRDGWLFLTGDSNDVIGQHTGAWVPGPRWKLSWWRLLRRRARRARRLGAAFVHTIVPDKESVYADLLPEEVVPAPRRPVHELLALAGRARTPLIYPVAELEAARTSGPPLYYPTDTHCTSRGAYVCYRATCAALGSQGVALEPVEEEALEWVDDTIEGDLGSKLEPAPSGTGVRARLRGDGRARLVADNRVEVTGRRLETERPGDGPTCVVFGTSYAVYMLRFLAESFRRMVFVHTTAADFVTVREERPDVVLVITSERGLRRPPSDRRAHELLAETVERKRRDGRVFEPARHRSEDWVSLLPPS